MADYNGWTNYETWATALWIDNEQGSYSERCEMAQQAWEDANGVKAYPSQTREDRARILLAERLKSWIEELTPDLGASLFADLLGAALGSVNWYEIAENFLEDVEKEPEESEVTE